MLRLTALGKSFTGTSIGINDWRAGVSKAQAAEAIEVRRKMGHACSKPLKLINANAALHKSMIDCVTTISRRRSTTSATTPPINEHKMIGTARQAPTKPSASAERSEGH